MASAIAAEWQLNPQDAGAGERLDGRRRDVGGCPAPAGVCGRDGAGRAVGKEQRPLHEALSKHYEISALTRPLLQQAAAFSRDVSFRVQRSSLPSAR